MATYQEQIERRRLEREVKEKAEAERIAKQLSPEQIKNWREVLRHLVGPVAYIMTDEMVQRARDKMQDELSQSAAPSRSKEEE